MGVSRPSERSSAPRPPWIWIRVALGFLVCASSALAIDAWLRFWILPRRRNRETETIAAINRATALWGRVMFSMARRAVRLRVSVEGQVPSSGRYVVVANHQSSLDIPLIITTLRSLNLKFVSMERLRHGTPAVSLVLRHGGSVFVSKGNVGEDLAAMSRFAANLERVDGSPLIFPAGGLERDQGARRFYLAGIEILRRGSRLPILPVAVDGMQRSPAIGGILAIAGARVTIRVSRPIAFEEAERDPRATYEWIEQKIYRDVAEIRGDDGGTLASGSDVKSETGGNGAGS